MFDAERINLSYMQNKGNEKEIVQTHTMSRFNANKINLNSNKNTNITQSEIKADKVQISAENLNLESKQDIKTNKEIQNNVNIGIDIDMHKNINVKSGIGNQKIESTYKAVTTQAGIYAGKDGYDINVKNKTKLTGSTIQSKTDKNSLTTGTLEYKHIQNKAEYKTDGQGININTDKKGKLNEKGITPQIHPSLNKKETNETKTTIQNANIQIRDKENQKQDIQEIQTNAEIKLETLKEIYDKQEIEEQKEMIKTLQEIGNKTIHKIAQKNGWKEGSKEKLLMHTALGAIEGKLTGNTATGAIAGSLNEAIISKIEKEKGKQWIKDHPDTLQWISYLIGETVDQVTRGRTGKQTAVAGTKWNYFAFEERTVKVAKIGKILLERLDKKEITNKELIQILVDLNTIMIEQEPEKGNANVFYAENTASYKKGIQYLMTKGITKDSAISFFKEYNRYLREQDWSIIELRINIIKNSKGRIYAFDRIKEMPTPPEKYNPSSFSLGENFVSEIISSKADMTPELIVIQYVIKSPLAKTAVKIGGVTLLMTGYEMYQDYYKYDGWNLGKAWVADVIPTGGAILGGGIGNALLPGVGGIGGSALGSLGGEYFKTLLKDDIPTIKEEQSRRIYEGEVND
ncbi:hemagglutinin repeat-containing protein [Dialister micraerophilus]|uniref:hemagglutinin repeat-containing protein n=1 Tax=Dialister micraerophilus TaxID=309120 RepID=UPI0023F23DED|nr:hemagglutinin repeat-containing protein [Dialister micraerophilus]